MGRLIIVSNRLPVTARVNHGVSLTPSSGGLVSGLRDVTRNTECVWIGWPGDLPRLTAAKRHELEDALARHDAVPVYLGRREQRGFYEEISNGVLWPLFHYLPDAMPLHSRDWQTYRDVNQKFARAVAERYRPGDTIWVHDYHLLLVPAMLRELLPDAHIGFFLHIPFPSSELFSVLPPRSEILHGMLGADLIGFHTPSYLRHFIGALRRIIGVEAQVDRVPWRESGVRVGVYPMGIHGEGWARMAEQAEVVRSAAQTRNQYPEQKIIVGIDRLDYTKGILRRLLAFERLLKSEPALRGRIRFIQLTVPSRQGVESYTAFRRRVDELIGRINGEMGTTNWVPIHSMHRSLSQAEVAALYRCADVMLVTPLRDGMNLVAKEFVASRVDDDGVLILSEFAGAAWELGEALHVNPYDVDFMAERLRQALTMPEDERRERMRALRRQVMAQGVDRWAETFLADLSAARQPGSRVVTIPPALDAARILERTATAQHLVVLLDYDGTLVGFQGDPDQATPDEHLVELIESLALSPGVSVHIVSGRLRWWLERCFGRLPIGLHAEHGLWSRMPGHSAWRMSREVPTDWKEAVRPLLDQYTRATNGSFVEEKTASLAWHYRNATADFETAGDFGEHQAKELRLLLGELLSSTPIEVIAGAKVIEVRQQGIGKGGIVPSVLASAPAGAAILAVGDDRTDEELFSALPPAAQSIHVGDGASLARWRAQSIEDVLQLLRDLRDVRAGRSGPVRV